VSSGAGGVQPASATTATHPQNYPHAGLYRLKPGTFVRFFTRQPFSFQLVCLYAMFEYVRPQAIYAFMAGWPLPSWTVLLCLAAFVLEGLKLRKGTLADITLAVFSVILLISSFNAYKPSYSWEVIGSDYFAWVLIFVLISTIVNTEQRFFVFTFLYLLWSFKMSEHGAQAWAMRGFSFAKWGVSCAPQYFQNSGECGIQMAMYVPLALYFYTGLRTFWDLKRKLFIAAFPATGMLTIMASSSRGAQLALVAVLLWMVLRSRQRVRALVLTTVVAALLAVLLPAEQMDRFRNMGTDGTSIARRQYWDDGIKIANQFPAFGIGFNNWLPYYRTRYNPVGELPHNIFVQAWSELGYPGLLALVAMIIATFVVNFRTRKMARLMHDPGGGFLWSMGHGLDGALIGFLVSGFFVTVLYYPFFWINLAMTVALHNSTRNKLAQLNRNPAGVLVLPGAGAAAPARRQPGMRGGLANMPAQLPTPPGYAS